MIINIIVAFSNNHGIGYNNTLPWKISGDLKKFRNITIGEGNNAIIMGKNTWLSLKCKPLPKRDNLILSKTTSISSNNCNSFTNIDELYNFLNTKNYDDIWVIGGQSIYELFLNKNISNKFLTKYIYITYIDEYITCDTFFS